jgi:diguanylate cyclase (GGDEF)-like protein
VAVVSLPERQLAEIVVANEITADAVPRAPLTLPRHTRAFARIVLRDTDGDVHFDDEHPVQLALLVSCMTPRTWTARDIEMLRVVAGIAASELRLRATLAREARVADELRDHPLHDPVTELANRELFLDRVGQALIRDAGAERYLAVMSLSADQVPNIESTFGYEAAQDVIRELAKRLKVVVRNVDSVARLAGDELGVLLELLRQDSDAARVANRIHESLRAPITTTSGDFMLSATIGVALATKGDTAARLIQLARLARDRASTTGATYAIFDPDMQARAQLRLHREMELRRAVEDNEFDVHYQPIVALSSGRIAKIEALVRWRHPTRGLLPAADFIGLAEETGLVVPMDWWIVTRGCQQLHEWIEGATAKRDLGVSVNITAAHLKNRDLCEGIRGVLDKAGLPQHCLNLEVTEGTLIGDVENAKAILNQLRALGVSIHLDDFGTGYSSLHVLHELPLDAIKIDRRFIAHVAHSERDTQLVSTIRELARQMGLPVIAEGVETKEQLEVVRALQCEYAQGYVFSRPVPAAEMAELLTLDPRW